MNQKKALLVRLDPKTYDMLATVAKEHNVSMNALVVQSIRTFLTLFLSLKGEDAEDYVDGPLELPVRIDRTTAEQLIHMLAEEQMDPDFDGYTEEELIPKVMNAFGLTSAKQAKRVLSQLIRSRYLIVSLRKGDVRIFANAENAFVIKNGTSGPVPSAPYHRTSLQGISSRETSF